MIQVILLARVIFEEDWTQNYLVFQPLNKYFRYFSSWKSKGLSAIIEHILLEGHNATYDDFSILGTESNEFKLHLKESLLIKRDKPELNRNCYTHPLELFD